MLGHPDRLESVPQGYSVCCQSRLWESDRTLSPDNAQGHIQTNIPNRQTIAQLPRLLDMQAHVASHKWLGYGV